MKREIAELLVCPFCRGSLELQAFEENGEVNNGLLRCRCGQWFPIIDAIPRLLLGSLRGDYSSFLARFVPELISLQVKTSEAGENQVRKSYSFKWMKMPSFGFQKPKLLAFYDEWFRRKLGLPDQNAFEAYLKSKRAILDAGTGLGAKVGTIAKGNPHARVIGVDFSDSVVPAFVNTRRWPNAHILQADLMRLPFSEEQFDLIVCDGVLHHTPDPKKAFHALVSHLAPGGDIAIHVYKRLGPIREFCDDLLRSYSTALSPEECWEFSVPFTKLGEALANLKAILEIPEDLPFLGIKAGRYDLQRFIYYHFFKCFWNPDFTFEENNLVNFDWCHPVFASRHTEEEVAGWFREAGLTEIRVPRANENGVSVVGQRS